MNDSGLLAGRTLILIKHALPEIDPERPAPEWHLGDTGRAQAETLAEQLRAYAPQRVLTSVESKAHETGEIVANQLGLTCDTVTSIHEQERANEHYTDTATFQSRIRLLFTEPDTLHFGTETASDARQRFTAAIDGILQDYPEPIIAIVTHGTVLSLYAAPLLKRDAFELWRSLECGDFVVIH